MRPVLLKVRAFGPYAKENVIDFTELKESNIFLITGPTGAGKTTIFDAICYALYGESSGGKRDIKDLRSDFLEDEEVLTTVEFTFTVKGKDYFIRRIPKQLRRKKRGEGFREQNEMAEFKELGKDEDILTKITEVNSKIQEIIGIKSEQFRKIVMIPQGDFREFLYSNTSEKEDILRRIFETDYYTKIQRKLKEESDKIEDLKGKSEFVIRTNFKAIDLKDNLTLKNLIEDKAPAGEIIEETLKFIEKQKDESKILEENRDKARKNLEKAQIDYNEGKNFNEKFHLKEKTILEIENLENKKDEINKLIKDMDFFNRAKEVEIVQNQWENKKKEIKDLENKIAMLKETLEKEEEQYEVFREKTKEIPELKVKVQDLDKEKNILESYLNDVKTIRDKKDLIKKLNRDREDIERLKINLEESIGTLEKKEKEIHTLDKEMLLKEGKLNNGVTQEREFEEKLKDLRALISKINEGLKVNSKIETTRVSLKSEEMEFKKLNDLVKEKREIYLNSAVINLAKKLIDGKPCPVCGSTTHPKVHKITEGVPSKEEIEKLQENINLKQKEINEVSETLGKLVGSNENFYKDIKYILTEFKDKNIFEDIYTLALDLNLDKGMLSFKNNEKKLKDEITYEGKKLKDISVKNHIHIENLKEDIKTLKEKINSIKDIEGKLQVLKNKTKENQEEMLKITSLLAAQEEALNNIVTKVPKKLQDFQSLTTSIEKIKIEIKALGDKIENIEDLYNNKKVLVEKLKSNVETNIETRENLKKQEDILLKSFEEKLNLHFDNYESYRENIKTEDEIKRIDNTIKDYNLEYGAKSLYLKTLEEELKDKAPVDLDIISERILKFREDIKTMDIEIRNFVTSISNNEKIISFARDKYEAIKELESKYKVVGKLSKISNGKSYEKVTFETYVLVSYFDSVLKKASERLLKISGGRYYFIRKEDKRGGGKKGLDIDIYDNYTGKAREVKTLSGGESFNASLSLALGLSDEIQHNAGGVELNTIFIDEGFGTLDSEALDNSINVLMELQNNGRLVGVISHVHELKERIPSKLIIKKDKKGSEAFFEIP